jgi:anaerobic magnesium-protoporphyrin IX monomethyl ester cyclase
MSKNLKILLVSAVNTEVEVESRYPNLGMAYLVSMARKDLPGAAVEFLIADKDIPGVTASFKPDLAGISSVSQNYNIAKEYAAFFEKSGIPYIMGGVHITQMPATLPEGALAACLGEGEHTFADIVRAALGGRLRESIPEIPGLAYWDGAELKLTEPREQEPDLDNLPVPARDLLEIRPHAYMFTSRGCPFRCTFCSSTRFWQKLRLFSAEYVVDEVEMLVKNGVTMISFFDDLFVANFQRLEKIYELMENRGLLGKVQFTCSCRANVVKPELVALLKKMGVVSVGMGLESGDDEVLRFLKGGNISVAHNHEAINLLKDVGIAVNASFVIGSPGETREQVMNTYNFIKGSRLDLFDIYILTPLPGTPVWDMAKDRGLVGEDMDWSRLDVNQYRSPDKAIIMSDVLSHEEIIALYNKFRKLRLYRNMLKVINHPMKRDFPRIALRMLQEYLTGKLKRMRVTK